MDDILEDYVNVEALCDFMSNENSEETFSEILRKYEEENDLLEQTNLPEINQQFSNLEEQFFLQNGDLFLQIGANDDYVHHSKYDDLLEMTEIFSDNANTILELFESKPDEQETENKSTYSRKYDERKCKVCFKGFHNDRHLEKHEKSHNKPSKQETKTSKKHVVKKESVTPEYKCSICRQNFVNKRYLSDHENIHVGQKPYKCNICKTSFANSSNLYKHKLTHSNDKIFECSKCDKSFTLNRYLKAHTATHSNKRKYKCNKCGKRFKHRKSLFAHKERNHSSHES